MSWSLGMLSDRGSRPRGGYPDHGLAAHAEAAFVEAFGRPCDGVFFAPGRVNLLGAHLDYNGGDVLPVAVDRGVYCAVGVGNAAPGQPTVLRMRSLDRDVVVETHGESVLATERADDSFGWAAYPLGVWREFVLRTDRARLCVDAVFIGDLPIASGLSSSAAMEISFGTALDTLAGTALGARTVAEIGHAAETGFVGVPCGIMDQFASALAGGGQAMLLHCHQKRFELLPLPASELAILVVDTLKPRQLADERGFELRVQECREAFGRLRGVGVARECLAAYAPEEAEAAAEALGPLLVKRARHVTGEMQRVRDGVARLRAGDLAGFGRAVFESHLSTRDNYEVSCDELDAIVDTAREQRGVYGARLTGAGFGGCAVVLAHPDALGGVECAIRAAFSARFGREPDVLSLRPGPSPGQLPAG